MTNLLTLDLGYNMLTADVPTLVSFLNNKQPDWATTQTVPPTNLKATVQSSTGISLTWTPIAYTADSLREAVVDKLSSKLPAGPFWRLALGSDRVFSLMLSAARHFDNRPGRLYSFVGHKTSP